MAPLDYQSLKNTSRQILEPQKRTAGLTAVFFVLFTGILNLLLSLTADKLISLPDTLTGEALIQYFLDGHTKELIMLTVFDLAELCISLLCISLFSAYTLQIAQGRPAGGKTFFSTFRLLPRYLLLCILLAAALFALGFIASLALSFLYPLSSLLLIVATVLLGIVFYMFRLCLYAIADRPDCRIVTALRDCARFSNGHKKELLFFDIGFLWYTVIAILLSTVCAYIPDAIAAVGVKAGNAALSAWVQSNIGILDPACAVLSTIVILPLCYKFYTSINLTFALAYQQLKAQAAKSADTQPLAYQEFDPSEEQ